MLRRHYLNPATTDEGQDFWRILPPGAGKASKVVRMTARRGRANAVDLPALVRHACTTVKTTIVRELRNHFTDVAKGIEYGNFL